MAHINMGFRISFITTATKLHPCCHLPRCFKQGAICFFQQPTNEKWVHHVATPKQPLGFEGYLSVQNDIRYSAFCCFFWSIFWTIHPFPKLPDISRKIGKGMEMNRCFQSDTVSSIPIDFNSKGWLCGER